MPHGFSTAVTFTSFASKHHTTISNSNSVESNELAPVVSRSSLLRPQSSKGRSRPGTASSINRVQTPLSSPPPSLSSDSSLQNNTLNVRVDPVSKSFAPPANEPVWNEELKCWQNGDPKFVTQRANLRHAQSISQLKAAHASRPVPSISHSPSDLKAGDIKMPTWMSAKAELQILGRGGESGAELKLFIGNESRPVIRHFIPPANHSHSADYFNQSGVTQFLEITDVQVIHHSVFDRQHILSVRIPCASVMSPIPTLPSFDIDDSQTECKTNSRGTSSGLGGFFGFRSRGKTITATPTTPKTNDRYSPRFGDSPALPALSPDTYPSPATMSSFTSSSNGSEDLYDQVIYLCFETEQDHGDWFALLRSFCRCPPCGFRLHRRMEIKVLDLHEVRRASGDELSVRGMSDADKPKRELKPGWAAREKICAEVFIDDILLGRTTWQHAEEGKHMPFWGETLGFEELPDFAFCMSSNSNAELTSVLRLHRLIKGQSVLFATVELPVASAFARPQDERYPIRSTDSGLLIGELRMAVIFNEVAIQPREEYSMDPLFAGEAGVRLLYYLSARGQIEGTPDLFARIGLADGSNLPRLLAMCRLESQASAETLFRSNTPLSKLLEACLRLRCRTFLRHSLGPTIERVYNHKRSRSRIPDDGMKLSYDSLHIMLDLAKTCWSNMYLQRGHFPNFLRHVFAKLFQSVKDSHPLPGEEKLRYKALSSFLFLRLIGPALMRPHLFGLSDGLPTAAAQRTLTLLAKILNGLAFFTPRDMQRDEELSVFSKFILENGETMVDYLASFATPLDKFQCLPPAPSAICNFVVERCLNLPLAQAESIPKITTAGPIDAVADLAILAETLYDRRQDAPAYPLTFLEEEALAEASSQELDVVLKRVHRRAIELAGSEAADSENRVLRSSFSFDATYPGSPHVSYPIGSVSRRRGSPSMFKWSSLSLSLPAIPNTPPPVPPLPHTQRRKPLPMSPPHSPMTLGSVKQVIRVSHDDY